MSLTGQQKVKNTFLAIIQNIQQQEKRIAGRIISREQMRVT
jgi:hypothetical protein